MAYFMLLTSANNKKWEEEDMVLVEKSSKINSLKYDLEKYPALGSNKEPYVAKIELEFTTQKSKDAREFHDSLLKGIGLVNPSSEITWDVNQDNYKTTFYLKILTP